MRMIAIAFILGMILCMLFGVPYIDMLKKKMIGQFVVNICEAIHPHIILSNIYCGGLQTLHGLSPIDFALSSVTSESLFLRNLQPAI